jgi:hypothetical protein
MMRFGLGVLCLAWLGCTGTAGGFDAGLSADDSGAVDSGSGDSGTTDAGQPAADAGVDGGADAGPRADAGAGCPADAVFCEGFEGTTLDLAKWSVRGDAAAFTIDSTTPAREGSHSLHLAYGRPYSHTGTQSVQIKAPLPAPDDRVYLRAYLRFGNLGLPGAHPGFIDVIDSSGNELAFGSIINDFALLGWVPSKVDNALIWYEGPGYHASNEDGDATPDTENGLTKQTWLCVEMMFFGDHQFAGDTQHPNEEVKVWINGNEVPQMAASDAIWRAELAKEPPEHWSPVYAGANWRFGVESFGPQNVALDLWFDGLVLSPTRVGCLP